jgi:arylsulfatase A-like enzyme
MNVVLIVVDSLRASSLHFDPNSSPPGLPSTPFLRRLHGSSVAFSRAYATECWTLPTHLSMFTGLLPSEHGAHFQSMGYAGAAPTIAEIATAAGYETELITRNSLLDGSVPGVTRGFQTSTRALAPMAKGLNPLLLVLALAKPRVRRLIRSSGFFHRRQKESVDFLLTLARMGIPADRLALQHALDRMADLQRRGRRFFLFLNLYDVHAPYCPTESSPLRPLESPAALVESLKLTWVLPKISSHAYLRPGFRMSVASRRMLLTRYHRAIELMDAKLAWFHEEASRAGLLDDTLLVVTSDHGEAFGEHGLYLHDASVYNTHLHVPLWVQHPSLAPAVVDDVVSTRDLFGVLRGAVGSQPSGRLAGESTLLDAAWRRTRPAALAAHFHYPHVADALPRYRKDQRAVITRGAKVVALGGEISLFRDPNEEHPIRSSLGEAVEVWHREGLPEPAVVRCAGHLVGSRQAVRKAA